ncbi:MAG TPA: CpaF family protein [Caldisericia bacterium]|nr:CpaF family protein [Caldisericia bacterium]
MDILNSEEFYKSIRAYIFNFISPSEILREKEENPQKLKEKLRNLSIMAIQESKKIIPIVHQEAIINRLINEVFGFGIIQPLLDDDTITEIMINGPKEVYVERNGKIELTDLKFDSYDQILQIIDRIVSPLGRRIDESSPIVDARLPDGSRINAVIPPISVKSPTLTVRKFKEAILDYESLINLGTLSKEMSTLIDSLVKARVNILISGGTGSGKTTLLNVCSTSIPKDERIITIEDSIELKLHQPHVVSLEARPPNIEGKGEVTIRNIVINSLRMRPDRIIVGEVRGPEAFDMLQAMNTGHDGSLSTIHANSPKDVISRLISMVFMAGVDMPVAVLREMIFSAIEVIIQTSRFRDGSRKITSISELTSLENGEIIMHNIYNFDFENIDQNGKVNGKYVYNGISERIEKKISSFFKGESKEVEEAPNKKKIDSILKILEDKEADPSENNIDS